MGSCAAAGARRRYDSTNPAPPPCPSTTTSKGRPGEPRPPPAHSHPHVGTPQPPALGDLLRGVPTSHPPAAPAPPSRRRRRFRLQRDGDISGRRLFRKRPVDRVTPDAFISPPRGQGKGLARWGEAEAAGSGHGSDPGPSATATRELRLPRWPWRTRGAAGDGTMLPEEGLCPVKVFQDGYIAHRPLRAHKTGLRAKNPKKPSV